MLVVAVVAEVAAVVAAAAVAAVAAVATVVAAVAAAAAAAQWRHWKVTIGTDRPAVHCTQEKSSPSSVPGSHLMHWLRSSEEIEPYGQSRQRSPARELNWPSLQWAH